MVTSVLIDFGDPALTSYTHEASSNGGRVNGGVYGGTPEASKSRGYPFLYALTLNDGGTLEPGDAVYWNVYNLSSETVRIEFSGDSGGTWQTAQMGLVASTGVYIWANTNFTSTRFARWRVVLEGDPSVIDANNDDFTFNDLILSGVGIGLRFNHGFQVRNSSGIALDHCVASRNSENGLLNIVGSSATIDHGAFYRNVEIGLKVDAGQVAVSKSVFVASGCSAYNYYAADTNSIVWDYNTFHVVSNALMGTIVALGRDQDRPIRLDAGNRPRAA